MKFLKITSILFGIGFILALVFDLHNWVLAALFSAVILCSILIGTCSDRVVYPVLSDADKDPAFRFTELGRHFYPGGIVIYINNPAECWNFEHLIGEIVETSLVAPFSERWKVLDVERYQHAPPWREGEKIGLLVTSKF